MMRRSLILFALPLFAGLNGTALAGAMSPEQVGQLLAKSHAINSKCNILPEDKSQALRNVLARAEISLAEKVSVDAARKAMAAGRDEGKLAACDDAARKLVNDVSMMAGKATSTDVASEIASKAPAPASEPEPAVATEVAEPKVDVKDENPVDVAVAIAVEPPKPTEVPVAEPAAEEQAIAKKPVTPELEAQPKPKAKVEKVTKKPVAKKAEKPAAKKAAAKLAKPGKPKAQNLGSYAALAERYYVARRCGSMSRGQIGALYNRVLVSHRQAMSKNRPRDVQQALRSAEARADGQRCS
jgi:outer membrane biosynthesis protein TonB